MDGATTPGFRDGWYASRSDGVWDGLVRQGANKHQGLAGASPCKRASEGAGWSRFKPSVRDGLDGVPIGNLEWDECGAVQAR